MALATRAQRFERAFPRFALLAVVCALFCVPGTFHTAALAQASENEVLARLDAALALTEPDLPIHAWLQDATGMEYLLVLCAESRLAKSGWPYQVLDTDARVEDYVLARPRTPEAKAAATSLPAVQDDGIRLLLRATPTQTEELARIGFAVRRLSRDPIIWQPPRQTRTGLLDEAKGSDAFTPDPRIGSLIGRVQQTDLLALLKRITGDDTVVAGGEAYVIATRNTTSGTPMKKATEFAYERMQALGLEVSYHNWSSSIYANRNVIGKQAGSTRSNEVVLITAHLDDMPKGARAPGADDNASGSAAVLTAAAMFRQCRFERTVKFVLFTGEEQGLLGSDRYAAALAAAGENIAAVFNMDMLAWDGSGGPVLCLHTRTPSNPGCADDLAIASVFTNAVASYGLSGSLWPTIHSDADDASDQASFWDKGYAALYAEEDYVGGDFNPYYHTTSDTIAHMALGYFTAYTRAALATVAHLARLTEVVSFDAIEVASSDWSPGSGIGAALFHARHEPEAIEHGPDPRDLAWSNAPANPYSRWLKIYSDPDGVELATDARPPADQYVVSAKLSVVDASGAGVSCGNRLRFDFLTPPDSNRVYTARLRVDGRFAQPATDFECVTNLLEVAATGGYVVLPSLSQASNGVVYGTLTITATNAVPPRVAAGPRLTNGKFWVRYSGIPGLSYTVQASPGVTGLWTSITNIPAGNAGLFEFEDATEDAPDRFYRAVWP